MVLAQPPGSVAMPHSRRVQRAVLRESNPKARADAEQQGPRFAGDARTGPLAQSALSGFLPPVGAAPGPRKPCGLSSDSAQLDSAHGANRAQVAKRARRGVTAAVA
jgi:hypothetical protein